MIKTIAYKEFLEMLRDGRVKWGAGIVFLLLLTSLAIGWKHNQDVTQQHALAQDQVRDQWESQPEKNPHAGAHYGTYAFKPKMFLSTLDPGVDPYVGVSVWLEAHNQNQFEYRPAQDATAAQRFAELTAALVLQLLLPLLIILVSFSAFAGEREQGTLRQLLSLGVKPKQLAAGKALGIVGALGVLLVPATAIGALALTLATEPNTPGASWGRTIFMGVFYLLYLGVFVGISLTVSAMARSSRVALVGLIGFWIFNGLIAPRLTSDIARDLYPGLSVLEFESGIEHALDFGMDGSMPYPERLRNKTQETLDEYGVETVRDLPINFAGVRLTFNEDIGYEVYDKFYGDLYDNFRRQNQFRQAASLVAPLLAVRSLSMGLAGTDYAQHRDFAETAEEYRRLLVRTVNDDLTYNGAEGGRNYVAGRELWESLPDFDYEVRSASWVLGNHRLSLVLLLIWFGAVGIAVVWSTGKVKAG